MNRRVLFGALAAALGLALLSPSPTTVVAPPSQLAASTGAWPVYHGNDAHTGYDSTQPTASGATTGWVSPTLDDQVYASPLVWNGVVYAATLNGTVYALNQSTGAVLWSKNVGAPQTSGWVCGNTWGGILGTPLIDTAANRLYAVSEIAGTTPTYHLFGLDLANSGNIVLDVTLNPPNFDWKIQQQRGALALHNGYVYIPFGGRLGDCMDGGINYHGYIVAIPTGGGAEADFQTPNGSNGTLWTAGGIIVDDATSHIFGVTGNGGCPNPYNYNDAVIRFDNAGLSSTPSDYFTPQDYCANWSSNDEDLMNAVLINSNLMMASGKRGMGFLLNPGSLGGQGGQLFPTPKPATYVEEPVCFGNTNDATFSSMAYAAPYVYLECDGRGLVALHTDTATPAFTPCDATCAAPNWHAGSGITFGPPIVAGGIVWAASDGGGLYGFNATTGAQVYHSAGFGINRFVTPAEAGGQVFVPSKTVIRSFNMAFLNWTSLGGLVTSGPDSSSWSTSRADVFAVGGDNALWQKTWNGSAWSGWSSVGGYITGDPGAVSWGTNRIDVFVRGGDGALWHRGWTGSSWAQWDGLGGQMLYGPDAASWGTNRLDVFVIGGDHGLWHRAWDGTRWWPWEGLGGYLTSAPTAVSWGPNRIDVFARGGDNQLWHNAWTGTSWYGWQGLGGRLGSGPDAASCASGRLDILALGTDSSLWRLTWNGSTWSTWTPVGSTWTSDPSAVCSPASSTLNVFERGADNAVWTATLTGTT